MSEIGWQSGAERRGIAFRLAIGRRVETPRPSKCEIVADSHITTTQQLYQHGDIKGQTKALARVGEMLTATVAATTAVKNGLSTGEGAKNHAFTSGGPGET